MIMMTAMMTTIAACARWSAASQSAASKNDRTPRFFGAGFFMRRSTPGQLTGTAAAPYPACNNNDNHQGQGHCPKN